MTDKQQAYHKVLRKEQALCRVSEKLMGTQDGTGGSNKAVPFYVMAPVMCMYVAWVLREACAAGTGRLYFLARDGYPMYEAARIFCEKMDIPIECRYLYCSRYAWRRAEYQLLGEESLSYICLGGIDVNFRKLMSRAGLTESEGRQVAGLVGMSGDYETPLAYHRLKELRGQLASCVFFMEKMMEKSRRIYPLVAGYLEQEGLLEPVPWALVDSGWTGSMQKSLQHLLSSMGYEWKAEGYYFGMYEYPDGVGPDAYHCWYFSPGNGLGRKAYFSNSLFECIFSSPEGMAAGYEKREELYCPSLEKRWNPNREKVMETTECLKQYAGELSESLGREFIFDGEDKGRKKLAAALLGSFMGRPSPEEAREFGAYIFCDDVIGERDQKVAAVLTPGEIRDNWLLRKAASYLRGDNRRIRESAWLEGSMVCSGMAAAGLWHCTLCKYMLYFRKLVRNH